MSSQADFSAPSVADLKLSFIGAMENFLWLRDRASEFEATGLRTWPKDGDLLHLPFAAECEARRACADRAYARALQFYKAIEERTPAAIQSGLFPPPAAGARPSARRF